MFFKKIQKSRQKNNLTLLQALGTFKQFAAEIRLQPIAHYEGAVVCHIAELVYLLFFKKIQKSRQKNNLTLLRFKPIIRYYIAIESCHRRQL